MRTAPIAMVLASMKAEPPQRHIPLEVYAQLALFKDSPDPEFVRAGEYHLEVGDR
jgi:hypothetical protein